MLYSVNVLLKQCEQDLEHCSNHDFQITLNRIEVLEQLQQCGIEYTTLAQLNEIV